METLGQLLSVVVWHGSAIGWVLILLPGVVKRVRRDPTPAFPPVRLTQPLGHGGATNVALFCDAIKAIVPEALMSPGEEPNEILLTSPHVSENGLGLTWDDFGPTADRGTFYVDLGELGSGAFYELDVDTDLSSMFWIAVGYLREGPVYRQGHAWIHVREVGMWHPFSASTRRVSDFEPEWVARRPD